MTKLSESQPTNECESKRAWIGINREQPLRPPEDVQVKLGGEPLQNGLAQLVLTLTKLLHELMEQQAIRRMDGGGLTEEEIERLGMTLMRQAEEIERMRRLFDLKDEDLNLDLGPLGRLF